MSSLNQQLVIAKKIKEESSYIQTFACIDPFARKDKHKNGWARVSHTLFCEQGHGWARAHAESLVPHIYVFTQSS